MTHLTETEIVDLFEGRLAPLRAAHVDGCRACREQVDSLRDALQRASAIDVPEPSPLFWDHFAANVRERIASVEPAPAQWASWLGERSGTWASMVAAVAMLMLVVWMTKKPVGPHSDPPTPSTLASTAASRMPDTTAEPRLQDPIQDPVQDDEAWALVRTIADDTSWDDAREAGIAARPGSADRLVLDLSPDEQSELARLLREELKGRGGSPRTRG
jgi:hypothetical protein